MYIRAEVQAGAKRTTIKKKPKEHEWLITVKAPAERNEANEAVKELIAHEYGVRAKDLHFISGHRSKRKIFSLVDTPRAQ